MDNDVQKLINEMVEGYFQSPTKPEFRIYNKTLCPDLWDANQHLDPEVRQHLLQMAYDFYEKTDFKAPVLDVYFMGSSANYNWTPDSDVDVHVLIDLKQLQMPEETAESATHAASSLWNTEHDVMVKGHQVEMNIQPIEDAKPHVTGIYSLVKDLWVRKPVRQNINVDKPSILKKYNAMKQYIDASIATGSRDAMKEAKSYVDALRQYGLDTAGELGTENIVFKLLRARGIIKKLKDSITATYDKEMTVTEDGSMIAEGDADRAWIDGEEYWFDADEAVGPFMIFLDEQKKPHWMFLVNSTEDYFLDGKKICTGGSGTNRTHKNMVNRIQPKFPQVMFTRQGSEMVLGRTWKINNKVYFICWNSNFKLVTIPNVFHYLDLIFSAQCGVKDPKRIFYQTDAAESIPYNQFKQYGIFDPSLPDEEPQQEPIQSPEPDVSIDIGKGTTPPQKGSEFKDIHTMSPAEKKRELAKMGAVPKVPEIPDWKKKQMAGIDELVNDIADKAFEVTLKQVGAVHPKPFAPQLPNQKLDFSKMTMANIKSLRDKAGREWDYCRRHEDTEGCERASIKFAELHDELKRRMAFINAPITEAKTDSKRGAIFLANKFGVELDFGGRDGEYGISVEAPKGYVWKANGTHELISNSWTEEYTDPNTGVVTGKTTSKKELWDDIYERMQYGIEKCPTPDCEWCNELEETLAHSFETHYHGGDDYVEVFRNPTAREFKQCQPKYEVGALLYGRDIYTFNREKSYHKNVMTQMKMPDALSLLLYPDNTNANRFDILVTDATQGTQWHHNPKAAGYIENHPFFRGKQIDHIMYWDEDVVGDWADPDNKLMQGEPVKEGYGAGVPEQDRLHIPDHRWQIRSKDAPKTPKMKTEEMTEIIDEVLNRIFQSKT